MQSHIFSILTNFAHILPILHKQSLPSKMQQTNHKGVLKVASVNGCKWSISYNNSARCFLYFTISTTNHICPSQIHIWAHQPALAGFQE